MSIKRKWDLSSDEIKKRCVDEIITWLDEHQTEPIGIIAAEELLSTITENIGPDMYNKGLKDAKQLISTRFADLEVDLDLMLEK
jgi:uncharacterized protein (DUF2164 family)